jgi:hypothetical protein
MMIADPSMKIGIAMKLSMMIIKKMVRTSR